MHFCIMFSIPMHFRIILCISSAFVFLQNYFALYRIHLNHLKDHRELSSIFSSQLLFSILLQHIHILHYFHFVSFVISTHMANSLLFCKIRSRAVVTWVSSDLQMFGLDVIQKLSRSHRFYRIFVIEATHLALIASEVWVMYDKFAQHLISLLISGVKIC